jgi:phosphoribosylformylglycinamidine synthase
VAADPYEGGKQAVAEAYRNLSAVGATPIAITDNLNFGNPERPDTMGVIVKAIEGMAEACRALEFPVVSGNVSLYNETDGVGIPPTPVVGGIGLIENLDHVATLKGAQQGDELFTLGATDRHLGASVYARVILGLDGPAAGSPPRVDLAVAMRNAAIVRKLIGAGLVSAVHDVSDGGVACAAADMALASGIGVELRYADDDRDVSDLFGETQARYLLAIKPADREAAMKLMAEAPHFLTGWFGGDSLFSESRIPGRRIDVPLSTLRAAHEGWLPNYMRGGG